MKREATLDNIKTGIRESIVRVVWFGYWFLISPIQICVGLGLVIILVGFGSSESATGLGVISGRPFCEGTLVS